MPIFKGSDQISELFKGSLPISSVFKGTTLVFSAEGTVSILNASSGNTTTTTASVLFEDIALGSITDTTTFVIAIVCEGSGSRSSGSGIQAVRLNGVSVFMQTVNWWSASAGDIFIGYTTGLSGSTAQLEVDVKPTAYSQLSSLSFTLYSVDNMSEYWGDYSDASSTTGSLDTSIFTYNKGTTFHSAHLARTGITGATWTGVTQNGGLNPTGKYFTTASSANNVTETKAITLAASNGSGSGSILQVGFSTIYNKPYSDEAKAIFAAMDVQPSEKRKMQIGQIVDWYQTYNWWNLIDVLYVTAAHTEQAACINWKNPGTFDLTPVNSPVFVADRGFASTGSNQYLETGFKIGDGTASQDDTFAFVHINKNGSKSSDAVILSNGAAATNRVRITPHNASGSFAYQVNGNSGGSGTAYDGTGMFLAYRNDSATRRRLNFERYDVWDWLSSSGSETSGTPVTTTFQILRDYGTTATTSHRVGAVAIGSGIVTNNDAWLLQKPVAQYLTDIGADFDQESYAIIDAFSSAPNLERQQDINAVVRSLKDAGIWAKLDMLYVMAAHDSQAAGLNWINPGSNTLTATNSPTFTADRGYTGNGSNAYLTTGTALNTLTQYQRNSAHMGAYILTNVTSSTEYDIGILSSLNASLNTRSSGDLLARINQSSTNTETLPSATSIGHTVGNRSGSSSVQYYKDGASSGTSGTSSAAVASGHVTLLSANSGNYSSRQIAVAHLGSSLTSAEVATLHRVIDRYLRRVGAI